MRVKLGPGAGGGNGSLQDALHGGLRATRTAVLKTGLEVRPQEKGQRGVEVCPQERGWPLQVLFCP